MLYWGVEEHNTWYCWSLKIISVSNNKLNYFTIFWYYSHCFMPKHTAVCIKICLYATFSFSKLLIDIFLILKISTITFNEAFSGKHSCIKTKSFKNKLCEQSCWKYIIEIWVLLSPQSKSKCNISPTDLYLLNCIFCKISTQKISVFQVKNKKKNHDDEFKGIDHSFFTAFIKYTSKTPFLNIWFLTLFTEESIEGKFVLHILIFLLSLFPCLSLWNDWFLIFSVHIQTITMTSWQNYFLSNHRRKQ